MRVPTFKTVSFDDSAVSRFQDNANYVFGALAKAEILNYVLVEVALKSTDTNIAHGLGRKPVGYLVVKSDTATIPSTSTSALGKATNEFSTSNIVLVGSAASANVTLFIF